MDLFHSTSIQGSIFVDATVFFVLFIALILIYIGDPPKNRAVLAILLAVLLLFYPFHEYYLYSKYDINACHIMAGFMALPIMIAYTLFRITEMQIKSPKVISDEKENWILKKINTMCMWHNCRGYIMFVLIVGFFILLCACSTDNLSLEQFMCCEDI